MALELMNPDSEAIYDEQISLLMAQILEICKRERIPMLATFQYQHASREGDGEAAFCTSRVPFAGEAACLAAATCELMRRPSFMAMTITTKPSPPEPQ